jgi:hypothetical protein
MSAVERLEERQDETPPPPDLLAGVSSVEILTLPCIAFHCAGMQLFTKGLGCTTSMQYRD